MIADSTKMSSAMTKQGATLIALWVTCGGAVEASSSNSEDGESPSSQSCQGIPVACQCAFEDGESPSSLSCESTPVAYQCALEDGPLDALEGQAVQVVRERIRRPQVDADAAIRLWQELAAVGLRQCQGCHSWPVMCDAGQEWDGIAKWFVFLCGWNV